MTENPMKLKIESIDLSRFVSTAKACFLVPYSSVPVKKNKKMRRGIWVAGFPL
jgi:hypothetical protein